MDCDRSHCCSHIADSFSTLDDAELAWRSRLGLKIAFPIPGRNSFTPGRHDSGEIRDSLDSHRSVSAMKKSSEYPTAYNWNRYTGLESRREKTAGVTSLVGAFLVKM